MTQMTAVSLSRLYALRAGYLFIVIGLGFTIWPALLDHEPGWPLMNGMVSSLLAAVSVLALVGIRYPMRMLPVLLFELTWKTIWLAAVALPLALDRQVDAATSRAIWECLLVVVLIPLIPWRYVIATYVTRASDRWTANGPPRAGA